MYICSMYLFDTHCIVKKIYIISAIRCSKLYCMALCHRQKINCKINNCGNWLCLSICLLPLHSMQVITLV